MRTSRVHNVFMVVLLGCFLLPLGIIHAQAIDPNDISSLVLTSNPQFPQPNQQVTLTVSSSAVDLNRSEIVWYVDDVLTKKGLDLDTFQVTAPSAGNQKTVKAVAISTEGKIVQRSIVLAPNNLSLVWQANTYTPPFYKGKALFTYQAGITVIAVPGSTAYGPQDLVYTWKKDGALIEDSGGLGKNSVTIAPNVIRNSSVVSVEAVSGDGNFKASNSVLVTPTGTTIRLYNNDPLLGVQFEHAIGDGDASTDTEVTIEAFPYFFSLVNRYQGNTQSTWTINGQEVLNAANSNSVTLRANPSARNATIDLNMFQTRFPLQSSNAHVTVTLATSTTQ